MSNHVISYHVNISFITYHVILDSFCPLLNILSSDKNLSKMTWQHQIEQIVVAAIFYFRKVLVFCRLIKRNQLE